LLDAVTVPQRVLPNLPPVVPSAVRGMERLGWPPAWWKWVAGRAEQKAAWSGGFRNLPRERLRGSCRPVVELPE